MYDKPHWFELIRVGSECAIVDPKRGKRFELRETRHRFQLEFRWNDRVSGWPLEVDVVTDSKGPRIKVVSADENSGKGGAGEAE